MLNRDGWQTDAIFAKPDVNKQTKQSTDKSAPHLTSLWAKKVALNCNLQPKWPSKGRLSSDGAMIIISLAARHTKKRNRREMVGEQ